LQKKRKGRLMSSAMKGNALPATAAVCGLCCEACTLYIATREDPERLKRIARMYGMTEEEVSCHGCRSHKLGPYCTTCRMKPCAEERGVSFCSECADYPCPTLKAFQGERPHRRDLWRDLERIRDVGYDAWSKEIQVTYACPECFTINSAYDRKCRKCGREPSCDYVARHGEAIQEYLSKR
jgi:hypothetical protein